MPPRVGRREDRGCNAVYMRNACKIISGKQTRRQYDHELDAFIWHHFHDDKTPEQGVPGWTDKTSIRPRPRRFHPVLPFGFLRYQGGIAVPNTVVEEWMTSNYKTPREEVRFLTWEQRLKLRLVISSGQLQEVVSAQCRKARNL